MIEKEAIDRHSLNPICPSRRDAHAVKHEGNKLSVHCVKAFLQIYFKAHPPSHGLLKSLTCSCANSEASLVRLPFKKAV